MPGLLVTYYPEVCQLFASLSQDKCWLLCVTDDALGILCQSAVLAICRFSNYLPVCHRITADCPDRWWEFRESQAFWMHLTTCEKKQTNPTIAAPLVFNASPSVLTIPMFANYLPGKCWLPWQTMGILAFWMHLTTSENKPSIALPLVFSASPAVLAIHMFANYCQFVEG